MGSGQANDTGLDLSWVLRRDRSAETARLPTAEAAVQEIREIAVESGVSMSVTDDTGADRTSRCTSAELFTVFGPDGSLPHEAFVEPAGSPAVSVRLFPEDDARITVEGVEFHDVPRDSVPGFLRSVHGGLATAKGRLFPPGQWLIVPLPGDETYKEPTLDSDLTPWPARRAPSGSRTYLATRWAGPKPKCAARGT